VPDPRALTLAHGAAFVVYLAFVAMLVAITYIDLRHYIIPDELSIYATPVGVAAMAGLDWLGYPAAGAAVLQAIEAVLSAGPDHAPLTPDIGGTAGTADLGSAIAQALR
jgi:prepilin signal peptidase PulO-like enzyme (type II secretory pathway)